MSDSVEVVRDPSRCLGYASCVITDPARFDLGEDGKVKILDPVVHPDALVLAEEAIRSCPAAALRLEKVSS